MSDPVKQFSRLLSRLESEKQRLEKRLAEINRALGRTKAADGPAAASRKPRRKFSAVTRAKMAAGQKARWARRKGAK